MGAKGGQKAIVVSKIVDKFEKNTHKFLRSPIVTKECISRAAKRTCS